MWWFPPVGRHAGGQATIMQQMCLPSPSGRNADMCHGIQLRQDTWARRICVCTRAEITQQMCSRHRADAGEVWQTCESYVTDMVRMQKDWMWLCYMFYSFNLEHTDAPFSYPLAHSAFSKLQLAVSRPAPNSRVLIPIIPEHAHCQWPQLSPAELLRGQIACPLPAPMRVHGTLLAS
jgi:hypothetical protein